MEQKLMSEKELRTFGLMMGAVLGIFLAIFLIKGKMVAAGVFGSIAAAFALAACVTPGRLRGVHTRWMRFAEVIGAFNAKLILGFIFLVFFTLIHGIFLIFRKDPLRRSFDASQDSYWEEREVVSVDPQRYEHQY